MANVGIKIRATDEASGVFGKVAAEAGKLQGAVASAGSSFDALGSSFAALGSAAVAGLSAISFASKIKDTIDLADSFNKLSQKTGIAVEDFSKLNYAAGLADVSTETLAAGMRKLNISIAEAAGGNKDKAAVFNALGVSFKDAAGHALSADKVFKNLSDVISKSADGSEKVAVGQDLMGKGFVELIPLANAGAKGLADMGDEAQKLGIVIGADFAKNAEEFNDNLRKIQLSSQGLMVTLGSDFVKSWSEVAKAMADAAVEGGAFAAVYAGIQTRLWGNDQYKNDKKLVEQTDLMLSLEKSLGVARKSGNAAYIKSREDALAAVNAEIKTTMAYRALLQGVADDMKKGEGEKPTGVTPPLKRANGLLGGGGAKAPKETGNAFAAEQDAAKEWAKAYEAAGKVRDDLVAKNLDLSKSEADLARYMESTAAAINEKTNPAMNDMVRAAYEANIALESMGKLADTIEAQQKRTSTAEDETRKERERVAAIGLTTKAVAELTATRLEEMAVAKERTIMAAKEIDLSGELAASIKAEAKEYRDRAALVRTGAMKEAGVEAAKAAADEWKRGWQETDNIARDVFTSWATNGGSAAKIIGDTLKKALLSAVYEATIKPLVFNVYASLTGGAPGTAGGAAGAIGNIGTIGNAVGGMSGLVGATNAFALSGAGAALGLSTPVALAVPSAAAGYSASAVIGAEAAVQAGSLTAAGATASSFAAGAAAAGPYIVAALVAAELMKYKVESKGNGITATIGGSTGLPSGSVGTFNEFEQTGGLFGGGTTTNRDWGVADQRVADYIGLNVQAITAANREYGKSLGLTSTAIDGFTKNIEVNLTGLDAAGQKAAIDAELAKFAADQSAAAYTDAVSAFARDGETTAATVARLSTDLAGVNSAFGALGYTLMDVSVAGAAAASGLAQAFGSLQNMQAQTAALYNNYYTAAEQKANTVGNVVTSLGAAGITGFTAEDVANASREQIRAVVDQYARGVGTATGDKQYAAIVAAANALTAYVPAFADAAKAVAAPAAPAGSTGGGGGGGAPVQDAALTAWQEATAAIVQTMGDLRTALVGEGVNSFAKLQAQFVIETAKAKAGDLAAAQDLPALAKSLADANKAQATSSVQQAVFTARIVETLGAVAGIASVGRNISVPAFASGGLHAGGWALVGEQGPELVNMPTARIYTAQDTRAMLGGQDTEALLQAVAELKAELAAIKAYTGSSASSGKKMAQVLDGAANGQNPLAIEAV